MSTISNQSELERRRRLLMNRGVVGGANPNATSIGPVSGAGSAPMQWGVEAQPRPGMVGSRTNLGDPYRPVLDDPARRDTTPTQPTQPTEAAMVARTSVPATRSVSGVNVGLPSDQIGGEIRRAAQDRSIVAQRLGATYRAAEMAKQSGNIDEYNRLMDQWQGGLEQRRSIESYGSDLSAAQPRSYVTPEKAAADQPLLRQQLIRAKQGMIQNEMDSINATPHYEAAGNSLVPDNIRNAKFSSPQDQIRQRAFIDFAAQEPTLDESGQLSTPDLIEQRRRSMETARLRAASANAPAEAAAAFPGTIDERGMNNRFDEASTRAAAAGTRAAGVYRERQQAKQFQKEYAIGEQKVATADQDRRRLGTDTASLQARAEYERAKRGMAIETGTVPFERAKMLYGDFITHMKNAAQGDPQSIASSENALDQLIKTWASMAPEQQAAMEGDIRAAITEIQLQRPGFWTSAMELVPVTWLLQGKNTLGDAQKTRGRIDATTAKLRGIVTQ